MRIIPILLVAATLHAADWPHWRGPARNSHSSESSGWDDGVRLPETARWEAEFGTGASAPLVVDGILYTMGWRGGHDTLHAVNAATGAPLWTQRYPCPQYGRHAIGDQTMYRGVSATPEYDADTGYLYTLSADGDLNCWDTRSEGKRVWSLNLYERYRITQRPQVTRRKGSLRDYGYTSSPLVLGDAVLVEAGAKTGNILAFDSHSGRQLWGSENTDPAGHSGGLVPMTIDGVACVAGITARHLVVTRVDGAKAGKEVARFPWITDFINNIATPTVVGNRVIVSSKYNIQSTALLEISLTGGAREIWRIEDATGVCSPLVHKDKIYWVNRGFYCFDLATGKGVWKGGRFTDPGSCVMTADERLLIWANNGDLMIADSATQSPDKARILQMRRGIFRGKAWPHIVFADGRIYVRDLSGAMKCFSLRPDDKPAVPVTPVSPLPPANIQAGDGLVFAWKRGDPAGPLSARGSARIDDAGRMQLADGSFHMPGDALLAAAKASNQLTIEAIITPANSQQKGPARIISLSQDAYHRNLTLGQERDQLILRLRTPQTGENGMKPETRLGRIQAGTPTHVLVTYRDGELVSYLNGRQAERSTRVRGSFSNWEAHQLVFGDEWKDQRDWQGILDGVAILTRFVGPEEAAARHAAAFAKSAPAGPAPSRGGIHAASITHLDRAAYRVVTPRATYIFDIAGGGFASLIDADGKDWISWQAGSGAGGAYRGIPNLVHPEGYFHPGGKGCRATLVHNGPERVSIQSDSIDGKWQTRWDIDADHARLSVLKADHHYWFLYEGTPGGALDAADRCIRPSGSTPASQGWTGDLPGDEWVAFADGERALLITQSHQDSHVDSYWPMQGKMTVFGFGRDGLDKHLDPVPATFTFGLINSTTFETLSAAAAARK